MAPRSPSTLSGDNLKKTQTAGAPLPPSRPGGGGGREGRGGEGGTVPILPVPGFKVQGTFYEGDRPSQGAVGVGLALAWWAINQQPPPLACAFLAKLTLILSEKGLLLL